MKPEELYKDRTIKLIAFSLGKRSFTVADALNASGMGLSQFIAVGKIIYSDETEIAHDVNTHEVKDWYLKPEALFGYMGLIEFEHSVESAKDAKIIAIISIIITGFLALGSIVAGLI